MNPEGLTPSAGLWPASQAPRCGRVPCDTRPHCRTLWQTEVSRGSGRPSPTALGTTSGPHCCSVFILLAVVGHRSLEAQTRSQEGKGRPGAAQPGPSSPRPGRRSAAQAPRCIRVHRGRGKQHISKTKSWWSLKDPLAPSPQACPAPLHPPRCREVGLAQPPRRGSSARRGQAAHPARLAAARPRLPAALQALPLLRVP